MRIQRIECELLHVPLARPRASPLESANGRLNHVVVLMVHLTTDEDLRGSGFAYALQSSGRALLAVAEDDIAPLLLNRTFWPSENRTPPTLAATIVVHAEPLY
ncbi:MAG: hypothetical protein EBV06_14275, partial [Planctomycetia bacterium]|nr:hypothetical protein [Planctomycetia bacterium]